MTPDLAETIALQALSWLAANDELLPVFMGATGASADDLRRGAQDPTVMASVLEFITMDDAWVTEFCDTVDLPYDAPLQARQVLPGADPHWT